MYFHRNTLNVAGEPRWMKSSYSNEYGANCVEVANLTTRVGIRDSKNTQGPALHVTPHAWARFIAFASEPVST
ncbi:DUF397 domain-containing protein [Streptomyces sp. NPDC051018]|uniref:DUF397 domain-containing protein n=1 Tax=Streptomyces sp. NPDC051018 TaxID=3365639 RepID=UPI0037B982C9